VSILLPQALLLDLDDTLLDFDSGAALCWQTVCAQFAPQLGNVSAEQLREAIDTFRDWFWSDPERHHRGRLDLEMARQEIVTGALLRLGREEPALARNIAGAYARARETAFRLFPDTIETLNRLRQMGVRLALITNGQAELQRRKIERFALADYFAAIVIEGEFGVGKPDAQVYRHALEQLQVSPADAWMVGDNLEWEVAAPQRLGIQGIWYDVKGAGLPATSAVRPDRIIRTLAELLP
jgi:putative hydrolase of the HAD superfamily